LLENFKISEFGIQCLPHIHKSQLVKCTLEQLDAVHTLLTSDPFPWKTLCIEFQYTVLL